MQAARPGEDGAPSIPPGHCFRMLWEEQAVCPLRAPEAGDLADTGGDHVRQRLPREFGLGIVVEAERGFAVLPPQEAEAEDRQQDEWWNKAMGQTALTASLHRELSGDFAQSMKTAYGLCDDEGALR